MDRDMGMSLVE